MYKEKLRELFKTNPEIKKDLEELKFGTKYYHNPNFNGGEVCKYINYNLSIDSKGKPFKSSEKPQLIIGNSISEHHLRMYCLIKDIKLDFSKQNILLDNGMENDGIYINYEYIKAFDNQNEEVYEKIFNYLTK